MFDVDPIPLFVVAALSLALSTVWYSESLFGRLWMSAIGMTREEVERGEGMLLQKIAIEFLLRLASLYVLAYFLLLEEKAGSHSAIFVAGLLALLVSVTHVGAVLWEKKPISYLYISAGYNCLVLLGGALVIMRWPW